MTEETGALREETDVHRSVKEALANLIEDGDDGQEAAVFSAEALSTVEEIVDAFIDEGPDLIDCVETVLIVAHLLETEQGSPRAAKQLVAIVDRDKVIDAMKALNRVKDEERRENVGKTAKEFSKFAAKEESNTAPKEGDEAPKGSLKLGALDFPKRM